MNAHLTPHRGSPSPLGVSIQAGRVNFALCSLSASMVQLSLFRAHTDHTFATFSLDAEIHRTGGIWHIALEGLENPQGVEYVYHIDGVGPLIDPYARFLNTSTVWGEARGHYRPRGIISTPAPFDWEETQPPRLPLPQIILFEM